MYKTLAAIAAMMATPAIANFTPTTIVSYYSPSKGDFDRVFGDFDIVEFSEKNQSGSSSFYMENDRYKLSGLTMPDGNVCIVWALDLGEGV